MVNSETQLLTLCPWEWLDAIQYSFSTCESTLMSGNSSCCPLTDWNCLLICIHIPAASLRIGFKMIKGSGLVAHISNSNTWEMDTGGPEASLYPIIDESRILMLPTSYYLSQSCECFLGTEICIWFHHKISEQFATSAEASFPVLFTLDTHIWYCVPLL